ncbi:lyase family protein [Thalassobacillus sp. C254]|uniref:lyase family protein n=1 Tax=Thalassobacillus sp. C254 TaxID=1225341 RepID=UPI000A599F7E|nr:lyase family protein [Thalassobacillus sp. C254]
MSSTGQFRIEKDTLGEVKVPAYAYYGSQTQRAADNFQISGITLPRSFIRAQGIIKASAAQANMKLGELPDNIGRVIVQAAEEVIEGKWDHQFIVDVYQAGAGTSQNMNVNEIIGNRATELLGSSLDPSANDFRVHPHNHVNMSQSTNDTFPSALHIATVENISEQLLPAIERLVKELNVKSEEFNSIIKSGRTHLHDAVPMKLGQEFAGYTDTIRFVYENIKASLDPFYEIGLGGNAIGTVINTHPDYPQTVIQEINSRINYPFRQPVEMFSFMQNRNAALRMMSVLKELAVHLIKITSDLRLLSSGPRTGLAEISLPPFSLVQP